MFTGLVETLGTIQSLQPMGEDLRLIISAPGIPWNEVELGDSIAVNGVCLTVVSFVEQGFAADASTETINCTTLKLLKAGSIVNIERALTLQKPLGGHLVSGHVDGLVKLVKSQPDARSIRFYFEVPKELMHYVAAKGSVCLDGVSLTVNHVDGQIFDVNIIPHTQEMTNIKAWTVGQEVNLEIDIIARYLERFIQVKSQGDAKQGVTMQTLIDNGFA